ncbi:Cca1p [Sugiyamaella lignohabitans]|uniref:CCA tRNA nucleotidyltransferase, mitochondrial n=1 Tax=Sugiyamaella lignohabitans TaxID=796027 RepID=A0A161HK23_9ASCO|nr:Cca1p [Sugiyamaella lignohabitans]ANB13217.1 Cca1p [Sugiyamaella lignohabitans]
MATTNSDTGSHANASTGVGHDNQPLPVIALDPTEQKIRDLLVKFSSVFEKSEKNKREDGGADSKEPVVLRITGGWVRDKLLGKASHDIDIAINTSTGLVFAEALNEYITENAQVLGLEARSIHKIEKNPEKSKHLETATTKLYDLDIDFVNLRAEEYAGDSRIPTVRFGTPEEDAYRRDATLNALFYNLQEQKVEDFTGRGLQDLRDGILRTPLPSFVTFDEDPLRVLRLIRFSSTFGFEIEESATQAMSDPRIRLALIRKISRERVGTEVGKILRSSNPAKGLNEIAELGLEDSIFLLLDAYKPKGFEAPPSQLIPCVKVLDELVKSTPEQLHPELRSANILNSPSLWLASALNHWGTIQAIDEKKKPASAVSLIIRDGLKLPNNEGKLVSDLYALETAVQEAASNFETLSRKDLGVLIRKCDQHWRLYFVFAMIKQLMAENSNANEIFANYSSLIDKVYAFDVADAWALKPLVNGKQIQQAFGLRKGGPYLAETLNSLIEYQLANPGVSEAECLDYIMTLKCKYVSA